MSSLGSPLLGLMPVGGTHPSVPSYSTDPPITSGPDVTVPKEPPEVRDQTKYCEEGGGDLKNSNCRKKIKKEGSNPTQSVDGSTSKEVLQSKERDKVEGSIKALKQKLWEHRKGVQGMVGVKSHSDDCNKDCTPASQIREENQGGNVKDMESVGQEIELCNQRLLQEQRGEKNQQTNVQHSLRNKFHCELCDLPCTSQGSLDAHLAGKKHIKALQHDCDKHYNSESQIQGVENGKLWYCGKCNCIVPKLHYQMHIQGKKHNSTGKPPYCDDCKLLFRDKASFESHLDDNKHKKEMEKGKKGVGSRSPSADPAAGQ